MTEGEGRRYDAFEEMYEKEYDGIRRYMSRMILNDQGAAEDLTQEVFFVAYQKWEEVKSHPNPSGFLMKVAKNKLKKWYEKQHRLCVDEADAVERIARSRTGKREEDVFEMVDFYSSVENILSGRELNILRCYYEYGYTSSELSGSMGISESCFKVRVQRMKQKLRQSMTVLSFWIIVFWRTLFWGQL